MELLYDGIYEAILDGDPNKAVSHVEKALALNAPIEDVLNEGLIAPMKEVGRLFEEGEYFVPEMLISARAMKAGLEILRPLLTETDMPPVGAVLLGTVKGDIHDIGKNLVAMMLEGSGYKVIDLGVNVSPDKFVEAIETHQPDIMGMSALLTTTMREMDVTIQALIRAGVRERVRIMVGGAPLSEQFAARIGADGYAADAGKAVSLANALLQR
ncbi:MAG: cobalamin-binding protein [Chloroflexi bacterium]|nr:cobalamin-binding protein [Chloroflexota bacterium]